MPAHFHPMPIDEADQQRVHGTVPKEVYRMFKSRFPHHGAIQFAIRLVMESLPRMIELDEVYRNVFIEQMQQMYEDDRASQEGKMRLPIDPRQLSMLDVPAPETLNG